MPSGHLVYVHEGTLFATLFDLDKLEVVGQPIPILNEIHADRAGGAKFAFSREGALVYQKRGRSNDMILKWVRRDGEATHLEQDPANYRDLFLSPDGKRLALTKASATSGWDVWVFDLERDVRVRLTADPGFDGFPVWTPDGQYIAFSSSRDGPSNLYRKRADGTGEVERLTESPNGQTPSSLSPDGQIAFTESTSDTSQDIWTVWLDGDGPEIFLQTPFAESQASFSPDGRFIAYQSNDSGQTQVYVMSFPEKGSRWQVSTSGGAGPVWSRAAQELFYSTDNKIMMAPYTVEDDSFRSGTPRELASGVLLPGGSNFDVTPNGERFVILAQAEEETEAPQLVLVQNWFQELERLVPAK